MKQVYNHLRGRPDEPPLSKCPSLLQDRAESALLQIHHRLLERTAHDGRPSVLRGDDDSLHSRGHPIRGARSGARPTAKATESIENRSRCCSRCAREEDNERYFVIETVLRSSWTADPFCHASAPGSIFASGMSARAAFLAATDIEYSLSRSAAIFGSNWPSFVKAIMSWGMPKGSLSPRSTCHVCQVFP